jgi:polysaccharide deacetylase family protein (PEP-CTERM system associated)
MIAPPDILTIDVEEWFHGHNYLTQVPPAAWDRQEQRVVANTDRVLDLLARAGVRATFFVLGWTAARHRELVRRIAAAGHEIGCHSHAHPVVFAQDEAAFLADTDRALEALAACGVTPRGYRAPSFTITPPVHQYLARLRERGFTYDCSLFPVRHPRYGQPRSPRHPFLLESDGANAATADSPLLVIPMPTWRVLGVNVPFSGGGYLRLLPRWAYRLVRAGARRQGQPCVIYLHPWEFDTFRPTTGHGRLERWRSQGGQDTVVPKLEDLLRRGRFVTLGEYADALRAAGDLPVRRLPLTAPADAG